MSDMISIKEREDRLARLTQNVTKLPGSDPLLQAMPIDVNDHKRIRSALNVFLWTCLNASYPERYFQLSDDMLKSYEQEILSLPNVTPNGLILPKKENYLAYNYLQKEASAAFAKLGFGKGISRVQYPINIRMQNGRPNPAIDNRARASVKLHSDIWAGDPASAALCFLCLLGDPLTSSGIRFFKPSKFPLSMARALDDFNDGAALMEGTVELPQFDARGWYMADSYLIHQTTKNGSGVRISIDFRIIPTETVSSDLNEEPRRSSFFTTFDEWLKLGDERLITSEEGIRSFNPAASKDPYTQQGYPAKIDIINAHPTQEMRKAG